MENDDRDMGGNSAHVITSSFDFLFLLITSGWAVLPLEHREALAIVLGQQAVTQRRIWREKGVPLDIADRHLARLSVLCKELRADRPFEAKE